MGVWVAQGALGPCMAVEAENPARVTQESKHLMYTERGGMRCADMSSTGAEGCTCLAGFQAGSGQPPLAALAPALPPACPVSAGSPERSSQAVPIESPAAGASRCSAPAAPLRGWRPCCGCWPCLLSASGRPAGTRKWEETIRITNPWEHASKHPDKGAVEQ